MASFVKVWETRHSILEELVSTAREADSQRELEYHAAVSIQSWFRGCRVRAYLRYLHECAVTVQKNFRAYVGRKIYRQRLKECLEEMRRKHYHTMAAGIQSLWRGYYVRKYVFDYYAQKQYLQGLLKKNQIVRQRVESHWQKVEEERAQRDERVLELQTEREARSHHYMLSTQCMDGVFKPSNRSEPLSFEVRMHAVKFASQKKLHRPQVKRRTLSNDTCLPSTRRSTEDTLPPVMTTKVQASGPFRSPHEVWRQRVKPLDPTLRVATCYNSVEISRAELKAQEWRNRIIDEKFLPFTRQEHKYEPLLHTKAPYERPLYGTKQFRDEVPLKNTAAVPFRTVVPPIPVFEKLNSTY